MHRAWGADLVFEYCDCCGVQFSYGDATPDAARSWRRTWLREGAEWFHPERRPHAWNLEQQLEHVPADFR
jgi:hypothetical protein